MALPDNWPNFEGVDKGGRDGPKLSTEKLNHEDRYLGLLLFPGVGKRESTVIETKDKILVLSVAISRSRKATGSPKLRIGPHILIHTL